MKIDPKGVRSVELEEKSVALAGKSVELVGKIDPKGVRSVELEEKSVGLSGLCQSEVARNVGLSLKSVALAGKSVELSVVKLDLKGVRSVELVGVDEFPLGESHVSLGGRDVLEVHAEGVGEVNQRITFICQN